MKTPPLQWKTWKQDHPTKLNFQSPFMKVFTFLFLFSVSNYLINYFINPIWHLGTTLITDGETSDEFYFYTLPTSPPSDLECATTYDSLSLTWGNPTIGMVDNTSYQFSYTLVDSMWSKFEICFLVFWIQLFTYKLFWKKNSSDNFFHSKFWEARSVFILFFWKSM